MDSDNSIDDPLNLILESESDSDSSVTSKSMSSSSSSVSSSMVSEIVNVHSDTNDQRLDEVDTDLNYVDIFTSSESEMEVEQPLDEVPLAEVKKKSFAFLDRRTLVEVLGYSDKKFFDLFRFTKDTFMKLYDEMYPYLPEGKIKVLRKV